MDYNTVYQVIIKALAEADMDVDDLQADAIVTTVLCELFEDDSEPPDFEDEYVVPYDWPVYEEPTEEPHTR